jgi:hypothetical protein
MVRRIWVALTAALLIGALAPSAGTAAAAVSPTPAATPQLATSGKDGSVETVRQIVQCGDTMYAVGQFTNVRNAGQSQVIARRNAFAFSALPPYRVTAWNPMPDGQVDTVTCAPDGAVLIGGRFNNAGGTTNRNLAKVDAATGTSLKFSFKPPARVAHLEVVQGHLLVGGFFAGYLASVDPVTGKADGYTLPTFSGTYVFPGVSAHTTRVWNMTVHPAGTSVLLTGVFTSVGGQHHEQVVRLDLGETGATVSPWSPRDLYTHCAPNQPFYAQDAAWSPDGSKIYVVTTGYKPLGSGGSLRTGPCDAAIGYNAEPQVEFSGRAWINYTGCDSLYSVAADDTTVFVAGPQRWIDNALSCDRKGLFARAQAGLGEIDPVTGRSQPGPDRGRGYGAGDLLRTPAGLWIASDNQDNTDTCGGQRGHMGICFLPNP